MRLLNVNGKLVSKNVQKYKIDWRKNTRSKVQTKVKRFLKEYWKNQTAYEEFPVYGTRLKVDFLNATKRTAIEVQGRQHNSYNSFFHKNSRANYLESIKRDQQKALWLEQNGFFLLEIREEEVNDLNKVFFIDNSSFPL